MTKKKEIKHIHNTFFDSILDLCEEHDPILVTSTMLAVAQRLARTVYDNDEAYVRIMQHIADNSLKVDPFIFDFEEERTYH